MQAFGIEINQGEKGIFNINTKKNIAPPATHNTALFGEDKILNILSVHDRFVKITAMLDTINIIKVIARNSFTSYPRCNPFFSPMIPFLV